MRYIEFVYLGLAGMSFTFMVTEYERLNGQRLVFVLISMTIFAFMFAFRRSQRKRFELLEQEHVNELEEELANWADEQEEARQKASQANKDDIANS
ncbi:MAG: hypothetical protein NWR72_08555 [Bacteroidia bacterium]|nr:hypothetical protein [Bacteroidia bacterium]